MTQYRIAIIGFGKIAQDQHVPVIAKSPDFDLVAVASQRGIGVEGLPVFASHDALFAEMPDLDAVAICTPPGPRYAIARAALAAGLNVLLEKPPTATLSELFELQRFAEQRGRVLMTTWHSQYNAGVDEAKRRLAGQKIARLSVDWREDVRKWHPGQKWIWQAGGFGVFDPGINAFSIVTKIMPDPIFVTSAELRTPKNADAPIAANLTFSDGSAAPMRAELDWGPIEREVWDVTVETAAGSLLRLSSGGSRLEVDGELIVDEKPQEYEGIYVHFIELLRSGCSYVDARPISLVADAFLLGRRLEVRLSARAERVAQ